jgi:hypothetical protein
MLGEDDAFAIRLGVEIVGRRLELGEPQERVVLLACMGGAGERQRQQEPKATASFILVLLHEYPKP